MLGPPAECFVLFWGNMEYLKKGAPAGPAPVGRGVAAKSGPPSNLFDGEKEKSRPK